MAAPERVLLLSCEHGGNRVPRAYAQLLAGAAERLDTHRGYDIGALAAARSLARRLNVTLFASTTTRLLIDLNRSPGHPRRFSEFTRPLDTAMRERIIARHYRPYRDAVTAWIDERTAAGAAVVHVSVHSFAGQLDGRARGCDIGLLYDPARPGEVEFCRRWQQDLRTVSPALRVRRNYPYRGVADGLVTALRRRFGPAQYAGIELEINQDLATGPVGEWRRLLRCLADSLPRG